VELIRGDIQSTVGSNFVKIQLGIEVIRVISLVGLFALVLMTMDAIAQEEHPDIPDEAKERMAYEIGSWHSETHFFNRSGEITRKENSQTVRNYVMENRMVEISGVIIETGAEFRAWVYFDLPSQKYTLTGINRDGRLLTMRGDLGTEFSWASDEMFRQDGTSYIIRFDHVDITPDSFTAVGLMSNDQGENWTVFSRQFLTRAGD
jgi:hypothetical protein